MQVRRAGSDFVSLFITVAVLFIVGCGGASGGGVGTGAATTTPLNTHQQWTWMRGAEADDPAPAGWPGPSLEPFNSDPWYGTMGVPVAYNGKGAGTVPGGRSSSAYWTGKDGTFWVFGGDVLGGSPATPTEGLYNDLWQYQPATNEWTWVGGSSTIPIEHGFFGPGDGGQPGVYGTLGTPNSANTPGGRENAVSWTDPAGNFWLFGGFGVDSTENTGDLNDLWEYNPTTAKWVWMSGNTTFASVNPGTGRPGIYGVQGVPALGNCPPGMDSSTGWTDASGDLWLFGGSGAGVIYDNLWKFSPATGEWTWMSGGGAKPSSTGVYGTLGIAAAGNSPPARSGATGWTDASGNMWLFGGGFNDLWKFNPTTLQWAWIAGHAGYVNNSYGFPVEPPASYGTLGVASATNVPSGRIGSTGWIDAAGNLWLLGGFGTDSTGSSGPLNDFWEFNKVAQQWIWMGGGTVGLQGGVYGVEGIASSTNLPGGRYDAASWIDSSGNLWLFAGNGLLSPAIGGSVSLNDLWFYKP